MTKGSDDEATRANERTRERILKRRSMFVATALVGLAATSCDKREPQVCLSIVAPPEDAGASAAPQTSASAQPDASATATATPAASAATSAAVTSDDTDAGAPPVPPTADPAPQPTIPPRVCLKMIRRPNKGTTVK